MRTSELLLPLVLAACTDSKDSGGEACDEYAFIDPACPTEACPAIAHADALVDLRTSTHGLIINSGAATCPVSEAVLSLDGTELSTVEVPELTAGESFQVYFDQNVFTDGSEHEFGVDLNGLSTMTFTPRTGVGCIVRGHLLEYIDEDQGIEVTACTEEPFVDTAIYHPYCAAISDAQARGWISGQADTGDINSNGDTTEIVYDAWTCTNMASTAAVLFNAYSLAETSDQPCPDVDGSEWYAPYMNAVQAATGVLAEPDGLCYPEGDLIRPKLEQLLEPL